MKRTDGEWSDLYLMRTNRMIRLINVKAPSYIVVQEAWLIIDAHYKGWIKGIFGRIYDVIRFKLLRIKYRLFGDKTFDKVDE